MLGYYLDTKTWFNLFRVIGGHTLHNIFLVGIQLRTISYYTTILSNWQTWPQFHLSMSLWSLQHMWEFLVPHISLWSLQHMWWTTIEIQTLLLLGWRNSTGREAACQTWNRSWKVRIYQRFQELAENDLCCWWWWSLRRMEQWRRVHEKLYWDKRQNPLTSEKVLREYSESLNPLKLFLSKNPNKLHGIFCEQLFHNCQCKSIASTQFVPL